MRNFEEGPRSEEEGRVEEQTEEETPERRFKGRMQKWGEVAIKVLQIVNPAKYEKYMPYSGKEDISDMWYWHRELYKSLVNEYSDRTGHLHSERGRQEQTKDYQEAKVLGDLLRKFGEINDEYEKAKKFSIERSRGTEMESLGDINVEDI